MLLSDFDYALPRELIAQSPLQRRDGSRLMVVDGVAGTWRHRRFHELDEWLRPDDCLVLNDTEVRRARLFGRKETGSRVELLLLERLDQGTGGRPDDRVQVWRALVRPGRRLPAGTRVDLADDVVAEVGEAEPGGARTVRVLGDHLDRRLAALGRLPLPPYIRRELPDPGRYQTIYAEQPGSVAAPTAGLHFTAELLDRLRRRGVRIAMLTLHVGPGTFQPVRVERIERHRMHAERYCVPEQAAAEIGRAREAAGRVVAVGTTVARSLEAAACGQGRVRTIAASTDLFIRPGYRFRVVDALLTNFHLPRSTLLMLVAAYAGRELVRSAYREAVRCRYRFYSLGDAMLLTGGGRSGGDV